MGQPGRCRPLRLGVREATLRSVDLPDVCLAPRRHELLAAWRDHPVGDPDEWVSLVKLLRFPVRCTQPRTEEAEATGPLPTGLGSYCLRPSAPGRSLFEPLGTGESRDSARVSRREQWRQASQKVVLPSIPTSI